MSKPTQFKVGTPVHKRMGARLRGVVIKPVPFINCTDGTYRDPQAGEDPVYVKWEDGTVGWVNGKYMAHGCDKPIHVIGTNGGRVPCGSEIHELDGTIRRNYCPSCQDTLSSAQGQEQT